MSLISNILAMFLAAHADNFIYILHRTGERSQLGKRKLHEGDLKNSEPGSAACRKCSKGSVKISQCHKSRHPQTIMAADAEAPQGETSVRQDDKTESSMDQDSGLHTPCISRKEQDSLGSKAGVVEPQSERACQNGSPGSTEFSLPRLMNIVRIMGDGGFLPHLTPKVVSMLFASAYGWGPLARNHCSTANSQGLPDEWLPPTRNPFINRTQRVPGFGGFGSRETMGLPFMYPYAFPPCFPVCPLAGLMPGRAVPHRASSAEGNRRTMKTGKRHCKMKVSSSQQNTNGSEESSGAIVNGCTNSHGGVFPEQLQRTETNIDNTEQGNLRCCDVSQTERDSNCTESTVQTPAEEDGTEPLDKSNAGPHECAVEVK